MPKLREDIKKAPRGALRDETRESFIYDESHDFGESDKLSITRHFSEASGEEAREFKTLESG